MNEIEKVRWNPTNIPKKPSSIYFGGCSFGCAFYVGVHKAFCQMWGDNYYKTTLICGGSAGTVMAVGIALGKSPEYLDNFYKTVANKALGKPPIYYASQYLEDSIRDMINEDELSYKKIEGRCCFGTTVFFSKHRWHISWENNDDLIECIKSSFHIPFYCKNVRPIKGSLALDGAYGFAGVDLVHDDNTLFVGSDPFAEITREFSKTQMIYPNVGKVYDEIVCSGYVNTLEWAKLGGLLIKKVGYRQPNYPALCVLWYMRYYEYIIILIEDYYKDIIIVITILISMLLYYYFSTLR